MEMQLDPKLMLTRDEAFALVPDLVRLTENKASSDWALWEKVNAIEVACKKGQSVIVAQKDYVDPLKSTYVRAKVSQVTHDWRNEDGPVIRVKAGQWSWRVDGNDHFLPV